MLFNSPTFLFGFLPLSLIVFYVLTSLNREAAKVFLIAISLLFYGTGTARFLPLLIGSVVVNYFLGRMIQMYYQREETSRVSLVRNIGVVGNLALLVYFKYTNFFLDNINAVTGTQFHIYGVILPLGISFFTFQRIGYLVDCARGEISKSRFNDFAAASVLFPQLISGPIVLYHELAPQIESRFLGSHAGRNVTVGLVIFAIGLFKKAVIADNASTSPTPCSTPPATAPPSVWRRPGSAPSPTRCSYTSISPAIPTWPSAPLACSGSDCP